MPGQGRLKVSAERALVPAAVAAETSGIDPSGNGEPEREEEIQKVRLVGGYSSKAQQDR